VLRDSLSNFDYPFEWNGDHIFTNYVQMHQRLTELGGYFVEVLSDPFTCFDASNYGALLIIDPEDYFSEAEIVKLRDDVENNELSLIVMGDWYNENVMKESSFVNNNTFETWQPVMAGANVGTINALLEPYNIAFGDKRVLTGDFVIDKRQVVIDSGTEIVKFPQGGYLISADLREEPLSKQSKKQTSQDIIQKPEPIMTKLNKTLGLRASIGEQNEINREESYKNTESQAIIPFYNETEEDSNLVPTIGILTSLQGLEKSGKIIVMSDSDCIDSSSVHYRDLYEEGGSKLSSKKCFWLMHKFADIATNKLREDYLIDDQYKLPNDF
jgi:hypothetical protein